MSGLRVSGLSKHYGGVQAVRDLGFELRLGECVALIGPNGAGKSTTFACIAGQTAPDAGEVRWCNAPLDGLDPADRLAHGVARTFQVAQTFEALTVLQNLQLVLQAASGLPAWDRLDARHGDDALALLDQVGLREQHDLQVAHLPYGAKKRLELAIALAGVRHAERRLLLLDEPAAGLAASERAALMSLVRGLAHTEGERGTTVLYTEHNMDAVFGVADRVLVLLDGHLAAVGRGDAIARDAMVQQRYLGSASHAPAAGVAAPRSDAVALDVAGLNVWHGAAQALFDVSIQVRAGELVVLQGLNGAGKSTLLAALMGLSDRATGEVSYENESIGAWTPTRRARRGLGYLPEDRRLFSGLTVDDNLMLAARGDVAAQRERVLDLFPALRGLLPRRADQISGGEQQMLALARTLMTQPRLLLLDEPCEGLAPLLVQAMRDALLRLRQEGLTLLVAEHNPVLAASADRVCTLVGGRWTA